MMPLGLMNTPSTFQKMMDKMFANLPFVRTYLDDVVVFYGIIEEHEDHFTRYSSLSRSTASR